MSQGRTLPLYDPSVQPPTWNERMAPGEFAMLSSFLKNEKAAIPARTGTASCGGESSQRDGYAHAVADVLLIGTHVASRCVLVTVGGKIGGTATASMISGSSWNTALRIGILMNTRGLVEPIVLNAEHCEHVLNRNYSRCSCSWPSIAKAMTVPLLDFSQKLTSTKLAA